MYLKSPAEITQMRQAGILLRSVMDELARTIEPGMTTLELDKIAYSRIQEAGAEPAFLNLYGFPNTLCISVNEQVVHGIPSRRKLREGDIVSVDCGLILEGFFADMAVTFPVGQISPEARSLMDTTQEALHAGIAAVKVNGRVSDIGAAIEKVVKDAGYHIVEDYTGHGIGRNLHEEPKVYNTGKKRGKKIRPGLVVAIEPMVNIGTADTDVLDDDWTVVTKDRSLSAHFEHTVAATQDGVEILTRPAEEKTASR